MKKKKMFIYIHQSILKGGVEKVFYNLFNNLPDDEFEITVLNYVAYLTDDLKSINYKGQHKRYFFLYDEFSRKKLYRLFQRIHNKIAPVLLPLWLSLQHYDIAIAAQEGMYAKFVDEKIHAKKKLLWIHNDMMLCRFTEAHFESPEAERECYSHFDSVVCVSDDVRKTMVQRFGEMDNLCVRHNPIDTDEINQKTKGKAVARDNDIPLFVCVGRLVEQKGFDRLLRVCKRLNDDGFRYRVWILGEGSDRLALEQFISENDLNNVTLLGNQSNPFRYMAVADWVLCTSRHEGFNMVLHEAVWCETPIITTRNAGAEELLGESQYGIIIDNDEDAIYCGIKKVLQDNSIHLRYLKAVKERKDFVSLDSRIEAIHELLK